MERWRDIKGYEGLYQVSNYGEVRNMKTNKILKGRICTGYFRVALCKNGKMKDFLIHRLVAETFLPNPLNLPFINHKIEGPNGKKMNMVIFNEDGTIDYEKTTIEWCDHTYNMNYGSRNRIISEKHTNGKLSKPVLQFTPTGEFVREWPSMAEARRNGFWHGAISACCRGKRKTAYGFIWKYKGEA